MPIVDKLLFLHQISQYFHGERFCTFPHNVKVKEKYCVSMEELLSYGNCWARIRHFWVIVQASIWMSVFQLSNCSPYVLSELEAMIKFTNLTKILCSCFNWMMRFLIERAQAKSENFMQKLMPKMHQFQTFQKLDVRIPIEKRNWRIFWCFD